MSNTNEMIAFNPARRVLWLFGEIQQRANHAERQGKASIQRDVLQSLLSTNSIAGLYSKLEQLQRLIEAMENRVREEKLPELEKKSFLGTLSATRDYFQAINPAPSGLITQLKASDLDKAKLEHRLESLAYHFDRIPFAPPLPKERFDQIESALGELEVKIADLPPVLRDVLLSHVHAMRAAVLDYPASGPSAATEAAGRGFMDILRVLRDVKWREFAKDLIIALDLLSRAVSFVQGDPPHPPRLLIDFRVDSLETGAFENSESLQLDAVAVDKEGSGSRSDPNCTSGEGA